MTEWGETPWIQCAHCHSTATPPDVRMHLPQGVTHRPQVLASVSSHPLSRAVVDTHESHVQVAPSLSCLAPLLRGVPPVHSVIVHAGMAFTPSRKHSRRGISEASD